MRLELKWKWSWDWSRDGGRIWSGDIAGAGMEIGWVTWLKTQVTKWMTGHVRTMVVGGYLDGVGGVGADSYHHRKSTGDMVPHHPPERRSRITQLPLMESLLIM